MSNLILNIELSCFKQERDGNYMSFCEDHNCAECCFEVEVPLLNEDIRRITSMGYYDAYFTETDPRTGVKSIRKICGKCVFHVEGLCEIYPHRPKLYPLSYDGENERVTLDDQCRHSAFYEVTETMKRQMETYVHKLRDEILWRKKTGVML